MNSARAAASTAALRVLARVPLLALLGTAPCAAQAPGHGVPHDQPGSAPAAPARSFEFRIFSDVQWLLDDRESWRNSFRLGELDLFLTAQLADKVSLLAEVAVENEEDGAFLVDLERLLIGYQAGDGLNVRLGRFHTGIGYYNTAHHHGSYFETAATRPLLFEFEDQGGPLPVHDVGVSVEGRIPSGALGLHYLVEVGNGQRWTKETTRPVPSVVDANAAKSVNVGLSVLPDRWPGLRAGASFYRDRIAGPEDQSVSSQVAAAFVAYRRPRAEVLAEAVWMRHHWSPARAVSNTAFYVQASRRLASTWLYGRYERTDLDDRTPLLGALHPLEGPTIGVRVDPAAAAAVKVQYERVRVGGPRPVNQFRAQVAFVF